MSSGNIRSQADLDAQRAKPIYWKHGAGEEHVRVRTGSDRGTGLCHCPRFRVVEMRAVRQNRFRGEELAGRQDGDVAGELGVLRADYEGVGVSGCREDGTSGVPTKGYLIYTLGGMRLDVAAVLLRNLAQALQQLEGAGRHLCRYRSSVAHPLPTYLMGKGRGTHESRCDHGHHQSISAMPLIHGLYKHLCICQTTSGSLDIVLGQQLVATRLPDQRALPVLSTRLGEDEGGG